MSTGDPYATGFRDGYRAAITVLHAWAKTMNDPHAEAVLNSAAFHLGWSRQHINARPRRTTGAEQMKKPSHSPRLLKALRKARRSLAYKFAKLCATLQEKNR